MKLQILLTIGVGSLSACSSHSPEGLLQSDAIKLIQKTPTKKTNLKLSVKLKDNESTILSAQKSGQIGKAVKFSKLEEFTYPHSYTLPQMNDSGFITSSKSRGFSSFNTGWTISLVPRKEGGVVILEGIIEHVTANIYRGTYGELSSPILAPVKISERAEYITISDNKSQFPAISKQTYPIAIRTILNKEYRALLPNGAELKVRLK